MKILSIGNFTTGWDGSICDEKHIADSLEDLGNEVIRQQRETGWNDPIPNVDLVLLAQWDGYPEDIQFKQAGIPTVYWAFDYQADGQEWHERLVKYSDLYLSKPWSDRKYPNWQWLPQDFAPSFLRSYETNDNPIDVLFTGSHLPWALERLETLKKIDENFNLTIHSVTPNEWKKAGFKHVYGPVMDEGLIELYGKAKINISIDHTITPGYWSDRNAQIMACEGFVLSRYVPGMELVFRDNITYFYSIEDCLEKIQLYLDNPMNAQVMAQRGYEFAQENLMVEHRVKDLLTIVGNL